VKRKSLDATKALDAHTISESTEKPEGFDEVAIGIGEQVYSILLLTIFFIEVCFFAHVFPFVMTHFTSNFTEHVLLAPHAHLSLSSAILLCYLFPLIFKLMLYRFQ
jgi:hypothetical protein